MNRQKSFTIDSPTLYLVGTPIGNLDDMTFRAVKTLQEVSIIYCEDTRVSRKLLSHYDIHKHLDTYHDFNKDIKTKDILSHLQNGESVALISDAGNPLISDPGYTVINEVIDQGFYVVSIPGPSAFISALQVSSLVVHPFYFHGFLDSKKTKQAKELLTLKDKPETLVFYESVHRINKTLNNMYEVLGNRNAVIARELTKKFEEIIRGTLEEIKDIEDLKGEFVIIIEGQKEETTLTTSVIEDIQLLIDKGFTKKDAIKETAKQRNLQKNDVYQEWISFENDQ